jgi:hypothetical protein
VAADSVTSSVSETEATPKRHNRRSLAGSAAPDEPGSPVPVVDGEKVPSVFKISPAKSSNSVEKKRFGEKKTGWWNKLMGG